MNRYRLMSFLCVITLTLTATAADKSLWRGLQFYEENDVFAFKNESDRHYTQGLRLTTTLNPQRNPNWLNDLSNTLCHCSYPFEPVLHVGFGQSIYTPANIKTAAPQPFDRPWAGWLYGSAILHLTEVVDPNAVGPTTTRQQMFEVDLGVVGQGAGARFAQTTIHEIIDSPKPLGWHNQIRNQPGINLIYMRNQRHGTRFADYTWNVGGDLGNVQTYAAAGVVGRIGYNISGFTASPMASTASGPGQRPPFEAYLFSGVDGRAVLHNIFIRGGSSNIEQKNLVYDGRVGGSMRYRSFRFTYNYVRRSREFTSPVAFAGTHDFGSFALVWEPALPVH